MLILIHVIIALSSIILSTVSAFRPSLRRILASYVMIGLTLGTGTYLVISLHTPMLHACTEGLAYLGVALTGVVIAQRRLAAEVATN